MRSPVLPLLWSLIVLIWIVATRAFGVELDGELSAGRDFVYLTSDVKQAILDERLTLGAGYTMVAGGAPPSARVGARASAALDVEPFAAEAAVGWAPPQGRRGWLTGEARAGGRLKRARISVEGEATVAGRRAEAVTRGSPIAVRQFQLGGEATATLDERLHLQAAAQLSFYDPSPALRSLGAADLGPLVTVAGRPERWAVALRGGWRPTPPLRLETGVGGLAYADGRGGAWLPRLAIRAGPFAGATVEASGEIAFGVGAARGDVRLVGTVGVEVER